MKSAAGRACAAAAGSLLLLLTACSSDDAGDDLQTIDPAVAVASPPTTAPPAGTVIPTDGTVDSVTFDAETGSIAALVAGRSIDILAADSPGTPARRIPLPTEVHSISAGQPGEVVALANGSVQRIDLRSAASTAVAVDGDARSAAPLPEGRIGVGLADGRTLVVAADGSIQHDIGGLASVDGLAAVGDELAALDRRQTALTLLDAGDGSVGLAVRAGEGATNVVSDHFDRILVTDTTGDELLVFTADPLLLRQRFPVGSSPYGIAYDERAELVWVTLTGTNEIVGYDLATGIPVEVARFQTVRQPNSVAVDSAGARLFVGSATGDGLQEIGLQGIGGR